MSQDIDEIMNSIGKRAQIAARTLAQTPYDIKTKALLAAADEIWKARDEIITANAKDMEYGREKGLSSAMLDRLMLDETRVKAMADGIKMVAALNDPVGEVMAAWDRPSGLGIERVRTPLGVIGVIFESRPNVTADAAALCLKSGNASILRGGSESFHSSGAILNAMKQGFAQAGLSEDVVQMVPTRDRAAVKALLTMTDYVDVVVPRGGKGLVGLVQREARVPVFAHLEGIVHIYVAPDADQNKAEAVVLNAKTRRTGICGALECLVIDKNYPHAQNLIHKLVEAGVEVRADEPWQDIDGVKPAQDEDYGYEFLDSVVAIKTVNSLEEAIDFITDHHSQHTDGIITENAETAMQFFNALDSAILMWNASTQFADGGEFGMGAEIGIATGKIHARGPVGAEQLTSFQYRVTGNGTIRS